MAWPKLEVGKGRAEVCGEKEEKCEKEGKEKENLMVLCRYI